MRDGAVPGAITPSCLGSPPTPSFIPPTSLAPSSLPAQATGVSQLKKPNKSHSDMYICSTFEFAKNTQLGSLDGLV